MAYDDESVTEWIDELKLGDSQAAQKLWERYYDRMVRASRRVLLGSSRAAMDEEDAAISAFDSFCRRAGEDQFPRLDDRHDLWKLLITITIRKSLKQARREGLRAAECFRRELESPQPSPETAAQLNEAFLERLKRLRTEETRQIAMFKLQAYTHAEIASALGRSVAFVERKLALIRNIWAEDKFDE